MGALSSPAVEDYGRDGVLFPIPALDPEEAAHYRAAVEELVSRLGGDPKPADMGQPHLHFRWAHRLATHPAVLDAIESVLGPNILIHSTSIFRKPPRSGSYVSWHQDGAYWGLNAPLLTSAWIALTESTPANGCLRVVPGSHRQRILPYKESPTADNLLVSGLEVAVEVDENQAVDVVLAPGEMSLHQVDIIHGSSANRSEASRIGYAVRYVAPELSQALPHHAVVLARGCDDHHHYEIRTELPANDFEEGLMAQREFSERWRLRRLGR